MPLRKPVLTPKRTTLSPLCLNRSIERARLRNIRDENDVQLLSASWVCSEDVGFLLLCANCGAHVEPERALMSTNSCSEYTGCVTRPSLSRMSSTCAAMKPDAPVSRTRFADMIRE